MESKSLWFNIPNQLDICLKERNIIVTGAWKSLGIACNKSVDGATQRKIITFTKESFSETI